MPPRLNPGGKTPQLFNLLPVIILFSPDSPNPMVIFYDKPDPFPISGKTEN